MPDGSAGLRSGPVGSDPAAHPGVFANPLGASLPVVNCAVMSDLSIEVPTSHERLSDLREVLDREFGSLAPGLLETRWEGDTLHLSGPGATGTLDLESGHLVARARLQPPASMMRPMIESKISGLLESLARRDDA